MSEDKRDSKKDVGNRPLRPEVIELLHERHDFVSSQELCNKFGVSRTAIWKIINQLKEEGYEIEAVTRKGYRLMESPDVMTADEIRAQLAQNTDSKLSLGTEILCFDTIDSTNTRAAQLAEQGYPSGTLVVSDNQTAGKGRRGRSWDSPSGTGIFMTLMLKPEIEPNHASMLTLVAALAVARAIQAEIDSAMPQPLIKWPNDIVLNGKKIVGILTEMSAQIDYINHIVIGIGINVHNENFPEEIKATAGSIYTETGKHIKRSSLIAKFLMEFEKYYHVFLETEDLSGLMEEYNEFLVNMDREVRVLDPKGEYDGMAKGITETGELLVEVNDKAETIMKKISSGEVSVRGIYGYV